jgi:hypothetical protein
LEASIAVKLSASLTSFATATAEARKATLASFDHRDRRALPRAGLELSEALR